MTFHETVNGWGLRYFSASEFLYRGSSNATNGLNTDPPAKDWKNIKDAALAADEARHRLGSPISILSAYRSPAYNRAIKGAARSLHVQFRALDLKPIRASVADLHKILVQLRKEGFKGAQGIGRYSTFCHIDNGPTRDW
jgi:uncharacterized protein YcbK (DUF882 family)